MNSPTYGKITIRGRSLVTNGDTFGYNATTTHYNGIDTTAGHNFKMVNIGDKSIVQNGNTGWSWKGHDFQEIEVDDSAEVHNGDFDSVKTKNDWVKNSEENTTETRS